MMDSKNMYFTHLKESYQSNKYYMALGITWDTWGFQIYPQMPAPAGVQSALDTEKVVVKEVEVEMEVVVIQ